MSLNFRPAEIAHLSLLVQFVRAYYEFDHHKFDEELIRGLLTAIIADNSCGYIWLIETAGEAVGYVFLAIGSYSLEYGGRDAFIDEIFLQENYRGQGIGRQTIEFLKATCAGLGVKALHLEVERHNTSAQGFYRQVGFVDQDRYLMTQIIPGCPQP
jgi:GNAT superfamily N-acetyltransferase